MREFRIQCFLVLVLAATSGPMARSQVAPADPPADVQQIALRLEEVNEAHRVKMPDYESHRLMTVTYWGPFSQGEATESVLMTFSAPAVKQFKLLTATGAQFLRNHVFQRHIDAERASATADVQKASGLTLENYNMRLVGRERLAAGDCYVLDVSPKKSSRFTYVGRVWVQAADSAIVRIQGRPAINPSAWVSQGEFTTDFQKVGDFYFPQKTVSTSKLPFGGHARLTIEYDSYNILRAGASALGE